MRSQLVLGTVQLGMRYGLNNVAGQPGKEEVFRILDAALAGGIDTFDTAYAYGDAEDVLGQWLRARGNMRDIKIISKLKPHALNDHPDGTDAADIVRQEIEKSLARLGVDMLDGYLLHTSSYVYLANVVVGLQKAKAEKLTRHIGVSVYDEPEALHALELGLDYVQLPYNVFDRRFERINFFERAKQQGAMVFARSPFLQGLLLMQPKDVPSHLAGAVPLLRTFRDIAERHQISPLVAALLFASVHSHDAPVVFGVETLAQLKEVLDAAREEGTTARALIKELEETFSDTSRAIVNPSLWTASGKL